MRADSAGNNVAPVPHGVWCCGSGEYHRRFRHRGLDKAKPGAAEAAMAKVVKKSPAHANGARRATSTETR